MQSALSKQIKDQADHANEIEIDCKKQEMELQRLREEAILKQEELKKLDDSNARVK